MLLSATHGPDGSCACHETCPECSGDSYVMHYERGDHEVRACCPICHGDGVVAVDSAHLEAA